jgi:hypothetical protein
VSATRISLMASSSSFLFAVIVYMYATYTCLNSTVVVDCVTQLQKCQEGTGYVCADSKTGLKLQCECCGKLLLFKSVQDIFTEVDRCTLHMSAPQPLQCAPVLQQACLCTIV